MQNRCANWSVRLAPEIPKPIAELVKQTNATMNKIPTSRNDE
jgi:hypothetical protein